MGAVSEIREQQLDGILKLLLGREASVPHGEKQAHYAPRSGMQLHT